MNTLFQPHLVNGPWGDPVLYIEFKFDRRAILFDLGDVRLLPSRKLLKVTHVENYSNNLLLIAYEIRPDRVLEAHFPIEKAFRKSRLRETIKPFVD